jgi:HAD superfamily hydrolase (TIGR01544 family)
MTFPNSLDDFLEYLVSHAIHVRNRSDLREKLVRIKSEGLTKFQVVSDFDRTITPQWLKDPCSKTGRLLPCHASHGVIETSVHVSDDYRRATKSMADHYIPQEHDLSIPASRRAELCSEWYHKAHSIMLEERLSRDSLRQLVFDCWSGMEIHLRLGCGDLFSKLLEADIPVTVLSAGVSDVIEHVLDLEKIPIERRIVTDQSEDAVFVDSRIMVVGNRMIFDGTSGRHIGFSEPVIHPFNKRGAIADALARSSIRSVRPNALLMGDMIGDVDFVQSIPHLSEYIAVGFLNDRKENHQVWLEEYLKHFDIIITGGSASMDVVTRLIESLM